MSHQKKMLILSGKPFCSSLFIYFFVEIQKLWLSMEGIFWRDVIFFLNIVTVVEFCLKNLLSEKHWPKRVEAQIFKVSAVCWVCASEGTSRVSACNRGTAIDKPVQRCIYIESQWRFNSMLSPLVCRHICAAWKGTFFGRATNDRVFYYFDVSQRVLGGWLTRKVRLMNSNFTVHPILII